MKHSPSDYWNIPEKFGYLAVEDCISLTMQGGNRHVSLQVTVGGKRFHKQRLVLNPLSMFTTIESFRQIRDNLRSEHVKMILEQEQEKATAAFLEKQRNEIARKHRERIAEEQRRAEEAARRVYGPIRAILERVTPVIDPWAYRNVYGKPAEVFIF
jgi:hypothetical protein